MADFQTISELKERYTDSLLNLNGIFGVGIGRNAKKASDSNFIINIYAEKELFNEQLKSATLNFLQNDDFEIIYDFKPEDLLLRSSENEILQTNADWGRYRPMLAGIQLCVASFDMNSHFGTLCAFVKRLDQTDNNVYMLSNRHVFVDETHFVMQPFMTAKDLIGMPTHCSYFENADAALAKVDNPNILVPYYIEQIGEITETTSVTSDCIGKRVMKRGRTTGLTEGTIETINASIILDGLLNTDCVTVRADRNKVFIAAGDSGSPVVLCENNKLIGMAFASSGDYGGLGSFCTIDNVFRDLEIELLK